MQRCLAPQGSRCGIAATQTRPALQQRRSCLVRCDAGQEGGPAPSSPSTGNRPPPQRMPPPRGARPPMPPGFNPDIKVERVENLDKEVWAGVAAVDRGEEDNPTNFGRVALLVAGDIGMLALFAAIGRSGHGEALDLGAILGTAAPFIIGWLLASPLTGAYGKEAQKGEVGPAALAAVKNWGLGIPLGVGLRSLSRGYLPDKSFIIVSLAANLVLLVGWRAALAAATPKDTAAGTKRSGNRSGNPFEFLQLLSSLVKRW